ncbi:MAG: DUF192 domain-containing protein [Patescibacteria group bacterium]
MKKILIILVGFLIVLTAIFYYYSSEQKTWPYSYELNGRVYKLLTARNESEWQKGLMFIKSKKELKGADGMIFIFPDKQARSFWNKNTYLDLDLYWMDGDKVVNKSYLPSILKSKDTVVVKSSGEVNRVVEIIR